MSYQKFTSVQIETLQKHEEALEKYGLELMEKAILRSRELPIGHYPNGNWYTVYVLHSPEDGTPFYIMRDGNSFCEKDFNNWLTNKPASLTLVTKYYAHYKSVMSVSKKLRLRREILKQQTQKKEYVC